MDDTELSLDAGPESAVRRELLARIKRSGTARIDALVDAIGLSKTAVRGHLLRLEALGLVERVAVPGNGRGRPPLAFRVTARTQPLFPTSDGAMLTSLLQFLEQQGQQELVHAFFERLWRGRTEALNAELNRRSRGRTPGPRLRLTVLREHLERHDFMPVVRTEHGDESDITVEACHCPFPSVVRATRLPCRLESKFVEQALDASLVELRVANAEASSCVFRLKRRPSAKA